MDDWWTLLEPQRATAPFSLDRLHYFVGFATNYGPRPLMGFIAFLATSIAGSSPAAMQFLSALLVLAAALSMRSWLNRVMNVFPQYRNAAADLAVVFWLAVPWMMGETAWPTVAHNLVAQILLTEIARLLLARERLTVTLAILVGAGVVASGLIYEAFYFAIFPIIFFYVAFQRGVTKSRGQFAALLGVCCVAQGLAIGFNRYAAHVHAAVTKTFDGRWSALVIGNVLALPRTLLMSFSEHLVPVLFLAALVVVCALALWRAGLRIESQRKYCRYLAGWMTVAVSIFFLADAVYSAAGYGFGSLGVESRTLYPISFAFTIALCALLSCAFIDSLRIAKPALWGAAIALVLFLALAQRDRVQEWAYVWREELRILRTAPLDALGRLPAQAAILYVGPSTYHGMTIFSAEWDLTAAIGAQRPLDRNRRPYEKLRTIYPAGVGTWTWDGATLSGVQPGKPAVTFAVQQLYLWRQGAAGLQPLEKGFRLGPAGG